MAYGDTAHHTTTNTPPARAATDADLPIVDLSPLHTDDPDGDRRVAEAIGHAARTSGFFYVRGHAVPQQLMDAMFDVSRRFHALPRSEKMRYWCGFTTHHRGYVPFEENESTFPQKIQFSESFEVGFDAPGDHPDYLAGYRMTGPNIWPDVPGFKETVSAYYDAVFNLGLKMLDAIAIALDVPPAELRQHINTPLSMLRMLRYVPHDVADRTLMKGKSPHTDFECFTILMSDGPGLKVLATDGRWIDAPPKPGCFTVNIGDILEAWSGGQFRSTLHYVDNGNSERYSFPFFFGVDYDTVVQPMPKFRTATTLEQYPPFRAGDHLVAQETTAFRYLADAHAKGLMVNRPDPAQENTFERTSGTKAPVL